MDETLPPAIEKLLSFVGEVNIAGQIDGDELAVLARLVCDEFKIDDDSMEEWRTQQERGLKLAKLVKENRTYPFANASNVQYPLLTTAALQFNARAYPAIVAPRDIVKSTVYGSDPGGQKAARGERIASHMSWQFKTKIPEWETETDKLLTQLSLAGTLVRKVWQDHGQDRVRCRVIDAGDFVVNDSVKNLEEAPRASEKLALYPYEVRERQMSGVFLDIDLVEPEEEDTEAALEFIEQHRRVDLDGDGYAEPYIVTVHLESEKIVRIVADFDQSEINFEMTKSLTEQPDPMTGETVLVPQAIPTRVKSIRAGTYFVDYHFWPSMDGKFWSPGLSAMIGDLNDSINSILNMLHDAGHMSSLGGGFIGSEFRLKGAAQRFKPGEWKQVKSTGTTVRESIVPMTFPQPDPTLFALLGTLIDAGREIAGVQDILTGDAGAAKDMTASATLAIIDQGLQIFTAIYKRIFRSLKKEFKLVAKLNSENISPEEYNMFHDMRDENGQPIMLDPAQEYAMADMDIEPIADPQNVTKMQRMSMAQFLMGLVEMQLVDPQEVTQRILEAAGVGEVDDLMPKPNPVQEQMGQLQMMLQEAEANLKQAQAMKAQAEAMAAGQQAPPEDKTLEFQGQQISAHVEQQKLELERTKTELDAAKIGIERDKLTLEQNKTATDASLKRHEIETDAALETQKLATTLQVEAIKAEASKAEGGDGGAGEIKELAQAMTEVATAPRRVIRDESGRISGVEVAKQ